MQIIESKLRNKKDIFIFSFISKYFRLIRVDYNYYVLFVIKQIYDMNSSFCTSYKIRYSPLTQVFVMLVLNFLHALTNSIVILYQ